MDARIHMGSSMLVCGPAGGGKTSFVIRLIESAPHTFDDKVSHVYWFYGIETAQQPLLTKKGFITYRGLPDDFNFCEQNSVVVLDDLMDTAACWCDGSIHQIGPSQKFACNFYSTEPPTPTPRCAHPITQQSIYCPIPIVS